LIGNNEWAKLFAATVAPGRLLESHVVEVSPRGGEIAIMSGLICIPFHIDFPISFSFQTHWPHSSAAGTPRPHSSRCVRGRQHLVQPLAVADAPAAAYPDYERLCLSSYMVLEARWNPSTSGGGAIWAERPIESLVVRVCAAL
jgi:hypothetical protein